MESTSSAAIGSRALVGSSRTKTFGWATKALAIATRCCSPPLKVAIVRFRRAANDIKSNTSSTRFRIVSLERLSASIPKTSSSSTVSATKPLMGFCPTMPIRWASPPGFTSAVDIPSTSILPAKMPPVWWGTRPLIRRSNEDLPEPVGPITRTNSPSAISRLRSSITVVVEFG